MRKAQLAADLQQRSSSCSKVSHLPARKQVEGTLRCASGSQAGFVKLNLTSAMWHHNLQSRLMLTWFSLMQPLGRGSRTPSAALSHRIKPGGELVNLGSCQEGKNTHKILKPSTRPALINQSRFGKL